MATKVEQQLATLTEKLSKIDTSSLPDVPNPCASSGIEIPSIPEVPEVPDIKGAITSQLSGLSTDAQAALDNFSLPGNLDLDSFTDGLDLASIEAGLSSLGSDIASAVESQVSSLSVSLDGVLDSLGDLDNSIKNSIIDAATALDDIKETLNGDGVELPELKAKINSLTPACLINPTAIADVQTTASSTQNSINPAVSSSIENKIEEGNTPLKQPSVTVTSSVTKEPVMEVFDANTKFGSHATTATFINTKAHSFSFDEVKAASDNGDFVLTDMMDNFKLHGKLLERLNSPLTRRVTWDNGTAKVKVADGINLEDSNVGRKNGQTMYYQATKDGQWSDELLWELVKIIKYSFGYKSSIDIYWKKGSAGTYVPYVGVTVSKARNSIFSNDTTSFSDRDTVAGLKYDNGTLLFR